MKRGRPKQSSEAENAASDAESEGSEDEEVVDKNKDKSGSTDTAKHRKIKSSIQQDESDDPPKKKSEKRGRLKPSSQSTQSDSPSLEHDESVAARKPRKKRSQGKPLPILKEADDRRPSQIQNEDEIAMSREQKLVISADKCLFGQQSLQSKPLLLRLGDCPSQNSTMMQGCATQWSDDALNKAMKNKIKYSRIFRQGSIEYRVFDTEASDDGYEVPLRGIYPEPYASRANQVIKRDGIMERKFEYHESDEENVHRYFESLCPSSLNHGVQYDPNASDFCKATQILRQLKKNLEILRRRKDARGSGVDDTIQRVETELESLVAVKPHVIVVLGDNKIGKSFLINILLLVTEATNYGVMSSSQSKISQSFACLNVIEGLEAFKDTQPFRDPNDDVTEGVELLTSNKDELNGDMWRGKIDEERRSLEQILSDGKADSQDVQTTTFQYMLPVATKDKVCEGTTTAEAISVRYGSIFHFIVRYKSEFDLLDELKNFDWKSYFDSRDELTQEEMIRWDVKLRKYLIFVKQCDVKDLETEVYNLKDTEPNFEFELRNEKIKALAGQFKICSGSGISAICDRIFVRDRLSLLLEDREAALAIDSIVVFCPSDLLSEGVELKDLPGTNDTDPCKYTWTMESVRKADTVLVVLQNHLGTSASTTKMMQKASLFERMIRKSDHGILFVSLNEERQFRNSLSSFLHAIKHKPNLDRDGLDKTKNAILNELRVAWSGISEEDTALILNSKSKREHELSVLEFLGERFFSCRPLLWASLLMNDCLAAATDESQWRDAVSKAGVSLLLDAIAKTKKDLRPQLREFMQELQSISASSAREIQGLSIEQKEELLKRVAEVCRQTWKKKKSEFDQIERDDLGNTFQMNVARPIKDKFQGQFFQDIEAAFRFKIGNHVKTKFESALRNGPISRLALAEAFNSINEGRTPALDLHAIVFGASTLVADCYADLDLFQKKTLEIKEFVLEQLENWTAETLVLRICGNKRPSRKPRRFKPGQVSQPTESDLAPAKPEEQHPFEKYIKEAVKEFFSDGANFTITSTSRTYFSTHDRAQNSFSSSKALNLLWQDSKTQSICAWLDGAKSRNLKTKADYKTFFQSSVSDLSGLTKQSFVEMYIDKIKERMNDMLENMQGRGDGEPKRKRNGLPIFLFVIRNSLKPLLQMLKVGSENDSNSQPKDKLDTEIRVLLQQTIQILSQVFPVDESKVDRNFWNASQIASRLKLKKFSGKVMLRNECNLRLSASLMSKAKRWSRTQSEESMPADVAPEDEQGYQDYWRGKLGLNKYEGNETKLFVGKSDKDGSCLFHSFAQQMEEDGAVASYLRELLISYTEDNHRTDAQRKIFKDLEDKSLEDWVMEMNGGGWGDIIMIDAFSRLANVKVLVHNCISPGEPFLFPRDSAISSFPASTASGGDATIQIGWIGGCPPCGNHYVPVWTEEAYCMRYGGKPSPPMSITAQNLAKFDDATRKLIQEGRVPLAFDIDDTLIWHGTQSPPNGALLCRDLGFPNFGSMWILMRPCMMQSLKYLSQFFLLGICTAANQEWADCFIVLLKTLGLQRRIDCDNLFHPDHIVALDCNQNSDRKKSFDSVFRGINPDICIAVDDEDIHWEDKLVHQVVPISKFSERLAQGWTDQFSDEVKELEKTLFGVRKVLLGQCGIGPQVGGSGQPRRASQRFGTSMSLILRSFNKEKIKPGEIQQVEGISKSVTAFPKPGLPLQGTPFSDGSSGASTPCQSPDPCSSISGSRCVSSDGEGLKTEKALKIFLDESVLLFPPAGRRFYEEIHYSGGEIWLTFTTWHTIEHMSKSKDESKKGRANQFINARAALEKKKLSICVLDQTSEAEGVSKLKPQGGCVTEKELTLVMNAKSQGGYIVSSSNSVWKLCKQEGVCFLDPVACWQILKQLSIYGAERELRARKLHSRFERQTSLTSESVVPAATLTAAALTQTASLAASRPSPSQQRSSNRAGRAPSATASASRAARGELANVPGGVHLSGSLPRDDNMDAESFSALSDHVRTLRDL